MRQSLPLAVLAFAACSDATVERVEVDRWQRSVNLLQDLSHPSLRGRLAGTSESAEARRLIMAALNGIGIPAEEQTFQRGDYIFANIVSIIDGDPDDDAPVLVVTAHYDHLGKIGDDLFPGADDNASGSAALVAVAESFLARPPEHDIVLAWVDAEEFGLNGAYHLADSEFIPLERGVFNLNLDMISHNPDGEIMIVGDYHTPGIAELLQRMDRPDGVTLTAGLDSPDDGFNDITYRSDHAPFHEKGLPWVMLTVREHEHYHMPSDTFENVPLARYLDNLDVVTEAAQTIEGNLFTLTREQRTAD